MKRSRLAVMLLLVLALALPLGGIASGWDIGEMLRLTGIPQVVTWFGYEIDSAVKEVFGTPTLAPSGPSRVAPVYSTVLGKYVRAVQLTGPEEQLRKVRLVVQIPLIRPEGDADRFIPSASSDPARIEPVADVTVSAIVDFEP